MLLCRCAAATNAASAAASDVPLGDRLAKPPVWPWRLVLNPQEWAALQAAAKTVRVRACMPCAPHATLTQWHAPRAQLSLVSARAAEAVATMEEAMTGPGPGVGTTGVPRVVLMQPEEVSRSTVSDPPQARSLEAFAPWLSISCGTRLTRLPAALQVVRDAVKMAATHAGGCRHVLLMSCDPAVLESARQQRSIVSGTPAAVCAFLRDWLVQIADAHRAIDGQNAAANGAAAAAAAASAAGGRALAEDMRGDRRSKAVRFSSVLDDGGTRRGYRGYSPPPETEGEAAGDAGGGEAGEAAAAPVSRKREREGAALSARCDLPGSPPREHGAPGFAHVLEPQRSSEPPPGFPTQRLSPPPRMSAPSLDDCL
jgi:hypothetical protein